MCKFVSGIVLKNGDIICEPEFADSHELLIKVAGLTENAYANGVEYLARFEFTPPEDLTKISDTSLWTLRVDEDVKPSWWDKEKVRNYCERKVNSMIIRDARGTVFGGCWIFDGKEASVKQIVRGRIFCAVNGADLSGANLSGAYLSGAYLSGAYLSGANLSGANLSGAYLSRANLYGAYLSRANLSGADLSSADLSSADLSGAYLSRANLYGADLSGAYLSRANLSSADLSRANLYGADLSSANLYGADLSSADLSRANLYGADLSGAINYTLPDTWSIDRNGIVTRKVL